MQFIKPEQIISQINLKPGQTVVDFGCGAGFYSLAAAKFVGATGKVFACDIQDSKLTATASAANHAGLRNITTQHLNLEKPTSLTHGTADVVLLANLMHETKNLDAVLTNVYAVLKSKGHLLAVEWKTDRSPFGPVIEKRIHQNDLQDILERKGFKQVKEIKAGQYHYALLFEKL